ncbi:MAG: lysophospholipid acyltransferase family protein [Balneolaceae bacterium]
MDSVQILNFKDTSIQQSTVNKAAKPPFIPAQESPLFIRLFTFYMNWFFRFRFKHVWLAQNYYPGPGDKTIYFLNHTSWWDGLIPLFLNENLFKQKGRAMMEDNQMLKYRFFKKIGAFSIHLENPKSALVSLRYAIKSMQRPNSSLYIYPEGEIRPFSANKPDFKNGLAWLCEQLPDVDVVPVGVYMHSMKYSKPELMLYIDQPIDLDRSAGTDEINDVLQMEMRSTLRELYKNVKDEDAFEKLF